MREQIPEVKLQGAEGYNVLWNETPQISWQQGKQRPQLGRLRLDIRKSFLCKSCPTFTWVPLRGGGSPALEVFKIWIAKSMAHPTRCWWQLRFK